MGVLLGVAQLTACSGEQGQGEAERSAPKPDSGIDREALKRAVITRIASEHNFNPADVTEFSAELTDMGSQGGNTTAAFHVKGAFSVDASTPSNVYEAATQHVNANICMVAPDHCQGAHFHHAVRFDVTARVLTALDGSTKLSVDGPVVVDQRQPAGAQPAPGAGASPAPDSPPPTVSAASTPRPTGPAKPASIITRMPPRYPPQAVRQGHEGTVTLQLAVSASGQLSDVDVDTTSGYRELDKAAVDSVLSWRFLPATRGGIGEASRFRVPVTFSLNRIPAVHGVDAPPPIPGADHVDSGGGNSGGNRPSFDCGRASTPTEQAVCASPELSAMDARMAAAYRERLQAAPGQSDDVKQAQRAFIREREARCAGDARCIKGMMSSRLGELR
jgi:TonB family protein